MRAAIRSISAWSFSAMNGKAISNDRKMARIFGTKAMVISWICVSACRREMATPTASPTSITGLETTISVMMASRDTSRTSGPVMWLHLYRHLHDVFVGLNHAIADGNYRVDRDLGLRNRRDSVDEIPLPASRGACLGVGFASHLDDRTDCILKHGGEARVAFSFGGLPDDGQRRSVGRDTRDTGISACGSER